MTNPTCIIDACQKPARSSKADWCKMHYHRWYRHGSTDMVTSASDVSVSLGRRYRVLYLPSHPLAKRGGKVYEHRAVLYDAIGPGPHPCHWCSTAVDWAPKGDPRELQPDHLNNDGADNRPENLVPSCRTCNSTRGVQRRSDALRDAGWWSNNDTVANLAEGRKPRVVTLTPA
jgi:hypothetical protein